MTLGSAAGQVPSLVTPGDAEMLAGWLASPKIRRLSSKRDRRAVVARFSRWLDGRGLLAATTDDIDRWLSEATSVTTHATRTTYLVALHGFYAWAAEQDLIEAAPTVPLRAVRRTLQEALAADVDCLADGKEPTLKQLAGVYVAERLRRAEIIESTARNIRSALDGLAEVFGDGPIAELDTQGIEEWLETRSMCAPATRRGDLSEVKNFTAWLARRRFIPADPGPDVAKIRLPRYLPRGLAGEDVGRILVAAPDGRARLMVSLMVQEGLRCCEVAGLQMHDIGHDGTLRVVGKGGHERLLPLTDETARYLTAYLEEHPGGAGPLIRSYKQPWTGLRADTISGQMSELMALAGVKRRRRDRISGHSLRHTAATDMLLAGAHLRDVQAALGHASLSTTQMYLPTVVNNLKVAMGGRRYTT